MLVKDRMHTNAATIAPGDTIVSAHALMKQRRVRHLPVTEEGRVVGLVTMREIRPALPAVENPWEVLAARPRDEIPTVADVMVAKVITVAPETPIVEAARLMNARRVSCLPVVAAGTHLIGILTLTDLLDALIELVEPHPVSG